MREIELRINKLAQGIESIENGVLWFAGSDQDLRQEIIRTLDSCIFQSHPTKEDIAEGVENSCLKDTYSPYVLVLKTPFNHARQKAISMRGLDQERAFRLFLSIFAVADRRRRETECKGDCSHEWHNLQEL